MNTSTKRACLPCTACCKGWLSAEIYEHTLSVGNPCPYSTSSGCGIYEKRPENPCVLFVCSWVVDNSPLPDWMRPDQSGAIVLLNLPWRDIRVITAIPVGVTVPDRTLEWLKAYAVKHNRPLLYHERIREGDTFSGLKRFGFGPPKFRQQVAELIAEGDYSAVGMIS